MPSAALTSGLDHLDDVAHVLIQDDEIALGNVDAFISDRGSNQNVVISAGSECL